MYVTGMAPAYIAVATVVAGTGAIVSDQWLVKEGECVSRKVKGLGVVSGEVWEVR